MLSLKEKYKDYFKIGAAVNNRSIKSHADILSKHFNCITCENEMKYARLVTDEEHYDFSDADRIMEFASNNELEVRGHTLVWHNQTPEWVFEGADREQLLQRIKNHIATIGGRYQGQVFCWDVVNEAIEDKFGLILRQSKWLEILGDHFMDDIFQIARELLPGAQLFYNDYNETNGEKRVKIHQTIKNMIDRGIPVDGIGMQCHNNIYSPTTEEMKRTIELYAGLGVRIHITEMDVSLYEFSDHSKHTAPPADLIEKQAVAYDNYFRIFREYKDYIDCVTLWGVADDETWLDNFPVHNRKNWPLLFDENHNPKEALHRILNF